MIAMEGVIFLADAFSDRVKAATHGQRFESKDLLLGISIVFIIGLALFLIFYLRARKRHDRSDQRRLSQMIRGSSSNRSQAEGGDRRRKRRRRRSHRMRNPSLGETGGLPPPRAEGELPKD